MTEGLSVAEERIESALLLRLKGDLSRDSEGQLLRKYDWERALDGKLQYVVLDLSEIEYINSGGMAVLIRLTRQGRKGGVHAFAFGVSPHYQKLFRMVGLTETLMIYDDEDAVFQRIEALRDSCGEL